MPNPAYPELALGNIINPGSQSYEPVPGFTMQKLIGYFEIDPTDPKLVHPLRVPYTGNYEIVKPDDRLLLSGQRVWYGTGVRVPKNVSFAGVGSLTVKTDTPSASFVIPFPHAARNLYTAQLGQRVGAMNSPTNPVVPTLRPFWKVDSVSETIMTETPFQSNGLLSAPSETSGTMVVESNVPLVVTGKRDKILRVVVEFYMCGLATTTQPQDLWGYNNTTSEV